jgi:hypothetical protein
MKGTKNLYFTNCFWGLLLFCFFGVVADIYRLCKTG